MTKQDGKSSKLIFEESDDSFKKRTRKFLFYLIAIFIAFSFLLLYSFVYTDMALWIKGIVIAAIIIITIICIVLVLRNKKKFSKFKLYSNAIVISENIDPIEFSSIDKIKYYSSNKSIGFVHKDSTKVDLFIHGISTEDHERLLNELRKLKMNPELEQ